MKVLLCGGGNAIHVLTSYIGSLPDVDVAILSLFPGEANKLRDGMPENGVTCENNFGKKIVGKPIQISDDPASVVPGSDVVILALPSFTHDLYFEQLKPHLQPGVMLGSMPGQSGFDLAVRYNFGDAFCASSTLFATDTLPWACRIIEYGKSVQVLGTKQEIGVVLQPPDGETSIEPSCKTLQKLIGPLPVLKPSSNFLGCTLANPNTVHPTISYGFYRNFDGDLTKLTFDEAPLFYQGVDDRTGEMLSKVSDEVMELQRVLLKRYPSGSLDLSAMIHIRDMLLRYYYEDLEDKSTLATMLRTSRAHTGLVHPMIEVEGEGGMKKFAPNFKSRYFTEDLPCGMIVIRGIAQLAGVEMPVMDEVIMWCQNLMGKEFLVDGKIAGKDISMTRCPQKYGFTDLDTFMKANRYIVEDAKMDSVELGQ